MLMEYAHKYLTRYQLSQISRVWCHLALHVYGHAHTISRAWHHLALYVYGHAHTLLTVVIITLPNTHHKWDLLLIKDVRWWHSYIHASTAIQNFTTNSKCASLANKARRMQTLGGGGGERASMPHTGVEEAGVQTFKAGGQKSPEFTTLPNMESL